MALGNKLVGDVDGCWVGEDVGLRVLPSASGRKNASHPLVVALFQAAWKP